MLEELSQALAKLQPGQVVDVAFSPASIPALYEVIKVALDSDCYAVYREPKVYVKKLRPVDDTGYPGIAFAVPTHGKLDTFNSSFNACPATADRRNDVYMLHDSPSPKAVIDLAREKTSKEWIVFTHHDVYIPKSWGPRFWRAARDAERFGPVGVVGVFGVSGDRRVERIEAGAVMDQQGTRALVGQQPLPMQVRVLDGCVLGLRRDSGLCPDPELGWHFYDADVCLQAQERGLRVVAVEDWLLHRSAWREPDGAFRASEQVFRKKWARALPVEVPCALIS